jgi:hypothetical protein
MVIHRNLLVLGAVGIAVLAVAILYFSAGPRQQQGTAATSLPFAKTSGGNVVRGTGNTKNQQLDPSIDAASVDFRKQFASSHDYLSYARQVLPAAKAGNRDAQFYLFRSIENCAEGNRLFFQRGGKTLSLDQGIQWAVQRSLSPDQVELIYERCHKFLEENTNDLGSASDWLERATRAGQPLAETTTSAKLLLQSEQQNLQRAAGVTSPEAAGSVPNQSDPRALLRDAIESGDPEVIFSIGDLQTLINPSNPDAKLDRFAWMLVACQHGFDCSSDAEWVQRSCAGDPQCASANSPGELVRTLAGDSWPTVQEKAQDIAAKIDARRWDELGLGP